MISVHNDTIRLGPFPLKKFRRLLESYVTLEVLSLLKVLEEKRLVVFTDYYVEFHSYFSLEFYALFVYLVQYDSSFRKWADLLKTHTWIKKILSPESVRLRDVDLDEIRKRNIHLFPHQEKFIRRYSAYVANYDLKGQVLAFDQGLGKTLTAISLMLALKLPRILVIAPKSLVPVWEQELKDKAHETSVSTFEVKAPFRKWNIVNYDRITRIPTSFFSTGPIGLIVDESHFIKDLSAKRTQSVIELSRHETISDILLISGTPVKGRAEEWIPYLLILDPHITMSLAQQFTRIFLDDPILLRWVAALRMRMLVAREIKANVVPLPKKHVIDLKVKVQNLHRYVWDNVREEIRQMYPNIASELRQKYLAGWDEVRTELMKLGVSEAEILRYEKLLVRATLSNEDMLWFSETTSRWVRMLKKADLRDKLRSARKLALNFAMHVFGKVMGVVFHRRREECVRDIVSSNTELFCKILKSTSHKSLIVGTLLGGLKYANVLIPATCKVSSIYVDSETPSRMSVISEFRKNASIDVLIGSIGVLGVGLTLIEADKMIILNTPWRWSDVEQVIDRIHRIGQDKEVYIYICKLDTDELNMHNHMTLFAESSRKFLEEQLSIYIHSHTEK